MLDPRCARLRGHAHPCHDGFGAVLPVHLRSSRKDCARCGFLTAFEHEFRDCITALRSALASAHEVEDRLRAQLRMGQPPLTDEARAVMQVAAESGSDTAQEILDEDAGRRSSEERFTAFKVGDAVRVAKKNGPQAVWDCVQEGALSIMLQNRVDGECGWFDRNDVGISLEKERTANPKTAHGPSAECPSNHSGWSETNTDLVTCNTCGLVANGEYWKYHLAEGKDAAYVALKETHVKLLDDIYELTVERDGYRSALCDLVAFTRPLHPANACAAWERARDVLKNGPATPHRKDET